MESLVRVGVLDQVRATVAPWQGATIMSLVAGVFGGRAQGVPRQWTHLLATGSGEMVRPLFARGAPALPDCLVPLGGDIGEQLDRIGDTSVETLLSEMEKESCGFIPEVWQPIVRRPAEFISGYHRLLAGVWSAFAPIWKRAGPLLGRETERVGTAVVSGALDVVLTGIGPRCRFSGGALRLPDPCPRDVDLAGRRLVFVPLVSGVHGCAFDLDGADRVWVGYPLPGLGTLWGDEPLTDPASDPLALLLGPARAALLRYAERGITMGETAILLRCTAGTATYHCGQLEAANLVRRERRGREVRLQRTNRGDALLELLA